MERHWKIAIAILAVFVLVGAVNFPSLLRTVLRTRHSGVTEDQARREIVEQPISTPTDMPEKAQLFWASASSYGTLEPTEIGLTLSADPAERAKQLIAALIGRAPSPAQRTLGADTELLQFYVLPDGTAVADFSEALPTQVPSGILSEQMAVDSIARTLGANVPSVSRLKILVHGQEADTLAGHLDLSVFFPIAGPTPSPETSAAPPSVAPASPSPAPQAAAPPAAASHATDPH
jgi:hypothetical protein